MLDAAQVRARAQALRGADPETTLAWAVETFRGKVALTVSFGGGGVVLAHLISRIDRSVPVIFLDTRFHFRETYEFKQRFAEQYGLNLVELTPLTDPGPLYKTDPDRCCFIRKVEPLERAIVGFDAWVSAVRQDQSDARSSTELLEYHEIAGRPIVKVFPLAHWGRADVWRYIREHGVPHHPLLDQGYASIGCWPCTRPTAPGESERAGRWSGTGKTECGLHTFTVKQEG
ncbi:MAG TPA: phosphoadenylyl-sulfate reductase [Gemmatimonadales bacterium]|nr:phosphoadenylyl-sulfate reductase [Gemmatimonadales bacterium]